jgi:hypothetical protein
VNSARIDLAAKLEEEKVEKSIEQMEKDVK